MASPLQSCGTMDINGIDTICTNQLERVTGGAPPLPLRPVREAPVMRTGAPPTMGHVYPPYKPPTAFQRVRDFVGSIPDWIRFQSGHGGEVIGSLDSGGYNSSIGGP
jgi:hypothetical protein